MHRTETLRNSASHFDDPNRSRSATTAGTRLQEMIASGSRRLERRGGLERRSQPTQPEYAVASPAFAIVGEFPPGGLAKSDFPDRRLAIGQPNVFERGADHGVAPDAIVTAEPAVIDRPDIHRDPLAYRQIRRLSTHLHFVLEGECALGGNTGSARAVVRVPRRQEAVACESDDVAAKGVNDVSQGGEIVVQKFRELFGTEFRLLRETIRDFREPRDIQ